MYDEDDEWDDYFVPSVGNCCELCGCCCDVGDGCREDEVCLAGTAWCWVDHMTNPNTDCEAY